MRWPSIASPWKIFWPRTRAEIPIKDFSIATFKRGLAELETAKLIAKTVRKGRYFVNPSFVFNGDRVAFSTVIERKKESLQDELEARGQQRLDV